MSIPRSQWRPIAACVCGVLFGLGLAAAQMTNPSKVLNFLDLAGNWDASLFLVLGVATGLFAVAYKFLKGATSPLLDEKFHYPTVRLVDSSLVGGSVLFGTGWGIAGYCPGPIIASIGFGNPEALWFVPAMLVGIAVHRKISGVQEIHDV
jgi:uncharacterized membrane protein YedE/YeeE